MRDGKQSQSAPQGEIVLYQTDDGRTRVECRFVDESIWLTQRLMAELFQTSIPNINQHLKTIFEEDEVSPTRTIKKYLIVQSEGGNYSKTSNSSTGRWTRRSAAGRALQSRCSSGRGLPGAFGARNRLPAAGDGPFAE